MYELRRHPKDLVEIQISSSAGTTNEITLRLFLKTTQQFKSKEQIERRPPCVEALDDL
jgi:hypothetical protein